MADLSTSLCGVSLKNPIIAASGTYGFGLDYAPLYPPSLLGGISLKGTTLHPRDGNPPPRIAETPMGVLNSVGLQNPGVDVLIREALPALEGVDTVLIANIAGSTMEDCAEAVRRLEGTAVDVIELNVSCPNVKDGGIAFGTHPATVSQITRVVRDATSKPLMVKLSPNVTDITEIAKAAEAAGADAVSLINTLLGMRIDLRTRRPILHNNVGGLSGPAVFPVALRMVWQVARAVSIPVVGMGGISTGADALEMILAGACAVQVGTALFRDPWAPRRILDGLNEYLEEQGIPRLADLVGQVQPW